MADSDAALENVRLGFTCRFGGITVKGDLGEARATSQGTITIRAADGASPAAVRYGTRPITQDMYQQLPEQTGGDCSGICESVTRIRARSASAYGRPARRGADGHVGLPARTGAVQVDVRRSRTRGCLLRPSGRGHGHLPVLRARPGRARAQPPEVLLQLLRRAYDDRSQLTPAAVTTGSTSEVSCDGDSCALG